MPPVELTLDMVLVFAVIGVVVALFLLEWVRVDVVAVLAMVALPVLGLVDGKEAFSGFASTAVVSIIAVIIMGRGLDHTGVINRAVRPIIRFTGSNRSRAIFLLSFTIAVISSVMQNIGAAALFLPALRRISRQSGIGLSQMLMPVGFAAILGGTLTLVGSSPLIMLNDLTAPFGLKPFNLFSVMPIGLALVGTGIGFFLIFGKWILPQNNQGQQPRGEEGESDATYYPGVRRLFELSCPEAQTGQPSVVDLCEKFMLHTVILKNPLDVNPLFPPSRNTHIKPGARFAVYGTEENVEKAARRLGFQVHPEPDWFAVELSPDYSGVVEAVVSPHSRFIGKTLGEIHFRHGYLLAPLALFRRNKVYYSRLAGLELMPGDAILMHGRWEHFQRFRSTRDLVFSHSLDHEILHPQKSLLALGWFLIATFLVIFTGLSLPVCLMTGAIGMVVTGVLTIDEAYQGVDWRTVFLLAGLIPLGMATEKTGAAAFLAHQILNFMGAPSDFVMLLLIGAITTAFTLVVSNVGAAVLLVPLVIPLAQSTSLDPALAVLAVGVAASNSFILPTHQVNALYMGPGHYRSSHFIRAGLPLSLLFIVVMAGMLVAFY